MTSQISRRFELQRQEQLLDDAVTLALKAILDRNPCLPPLPEFKKAA